eukprot:Phypoly_transcript_06108.p1 GENE.Phypoly_transcript_06108~~Phypoly_transcript_06108.p1  ORF type:complete len:602 (+),score=54.36 Phypoly_transcript_06108:218-1807(+)
MTYSEADDAQNQLLQFIDNCDTHNVPCDAFHLSSGYTTGTDGKRYVFTWNTKKFPDAKGFVKKYQMKGVHIIANIKPCLLLTHPDIESVKTQGLFVKDSETNLPHVAKFWGGNGHYLDFTNPATCSWWKQKVTEALLNYGIDCTWNDNNEYEIWDDDAPCHGFGKSTPIGFIRPLMPLLMTRCSYEAQLAHAPSKRPFVICRSGCPGIQRYAQTWSGDNYTSWRSLRYNITMALGMSLSGAPNTGFDVGGFYGYKPEPELFLRWVQLGIFFPRFSIHSWHLDQTINEPWMYEEQFPLIKKALTFRYQLIPHLYSLLRISSQTGAPIVSPMVYHFQTDLECVNESFDFMLGSELLVAAVLYPLAHRKMSQGRRVYLPKENNWCEFDTGVWHKGGQYINLDAPFSRIPILAREGAIVHTAPTVNTREVFIFPPTFSQATEFASVLYEDDGETNAFRDGKFAEVAIMMTLYNSQTVNIDVSVTGDHKLPYQEITIISPKGEKRELVAENALKKWVADDRQYVVISLTLPKIG